MCGLCGVSFFSENKFEELKSFGEKLSVNLEHRGPDTQGFLYNKIGFKSLLFHQRLSILELSEKGSQPMVSKDQNLILSFNGEIYNHLELRNKLNKIRKIEWVGNSDTETLIESFSSIGIKQTIDLVEGMYSFALIDKKNSKLFLGRDLFGEKPLYYLNNNEEIIFSSELHNVNEKFFKIEQKAVNQLLHYNYIPNSSCIYKNWKKVDPGEIIVFDKNYEKKLYYNYKKKINESILKNQTFKFDSKNLEHKFESIFTKVIKDILIADVNVGVFLSGGIDSSLVACYATKLSKNINTFSIGIKDNKDYDESSSAEKIAKFINTNHDTIFVTNEEIIENIENSILSFDEPFADSSKILTYILSNKVKNKIKVALTGDGADELFGGYNRHIFAFYLKKLSKLFGNEFMYNKLFKYKLRLLSPMYKYFFSNLFAYSENKNNKIKSIIKYQDEKDLIDRIISNKNEYDKLNFDYLKESSVEKINYEKKENFFETVMNCDLNNYLTDDILVKVDRASMINSLETRAPFLNKNVYIFSKKLKDDEKIKYFKGKFFLRKILKKYLPNDLISSQKKGFSYPISNFFNNTKNEKWIKNALFVNSNQKVNLLSNENISQIFDLHRKKNVDYSKVLWSNLVLRLWLKRKGFIH